MLITVNDFWAEFGTRSLGYSGSDPYSEVVGGVNSHRCSLETRQHTAVYLRAETR